MLICLYQIELFDMYEGMMNYDSTVLKCLNLSYVVHTIV